MNSATKNISGSHSLIAMVLTILFCLGSAMVIIGWGPGSAMQSVSATAQPERSRF